MRYDMANGETQTLEKKKICLYFNLFTFFRGRSRTSVIGKEWSSGLRRYNYNWRIPGQTPQ